MLLFAILVLMGLVTARLALERPVASYSLPIGSANTSERAEQIVSTRIGFLYGPDIIYNGSSFPTGPLGDHVVARMWQEFVPEQLTWTATVNADAQKVVLDAASKGGLQTLSDYSNMLYADNLWKTVIPGGVADGMRTNATSDLLFAMERLSAQPYLVRRLDRSEKAEITVHDDIAMSIASVSQTELHAQGRLFYVDYRDQAELVETEGRHAAACDALFFIHPISKDFLPLAIRLNKGNSELYTPLDSFNDWTFAKMAFNLNDFWYAQWYHLVAIHSVVDLVHSAATRSLSNLHPVRALIDRLATQTYSFRMVAVKSLLNPGGPVDTFYAWSGMRAGQYASKLYHSGGASWSKNKFHTHLVSRGLINSSQGPELQRFPFYEDASAALGPIRKYISTFVESYYSDDILLYQDQELRALLAEASVAEIADFPRHFRTRDDLIDMLTHLAYLTSVLHGVLNANDPVHTTSTLPMHPAAFYAPMPTAKGVPDLLPFLPNLTQAVGQIALLANFNRPFLAASNRTLTHLFHSDELLACTNADVRAAAQRFQQEMQAFSATVRARRFDADGLCQGMPMVWRVLDPATAPFYMAI